MRPIIWYASLLHILWGIIIIASSGVPAATPLHMLNLLVPGHVMLASLLFTVASLALLGIHRPKRWWLLVPQQTILVCSAIAGLFAAVSGAYADGITRPHLFIFADQLPIILAAPFYTLGILRLLNGHADKHHSR